MKRLALLLGSLLVVTAAASAKEVVPAPVVVEEAPVQIVEKEVIVYRDKEEGFRPNGSLDLQYRYYGDTEGNGKNFPVYSSKEAWNKNNNYSRIQLQGNINMTEKQNLEYRIRAYNSLDENDDLNPTAKSTDTETRLRYFYNHGLVGDSNVDLTSRVHYNNSGSDQELEYQARFDFANYMFNSDMLKTDYFVIAPKYGYGWDDTNDSAYDNRLGVDLYTWHTLPWGFSTEFNVYLTQHFFGKNSEITKERGTEDKNFDVVVEAYLYNTTKLYTSENYSVDFGFEMGYDPYTWSQEKTWNGTKYNDDSTYSAYVLSYVQANYDVTENLRLYAAAGAEYRNWSVEEQDSAKNWRWQPTAWAGFKTTF